MEVTSCPLLPSLYNKPFNKSPSRDLIKGIELLKHELGISKESYYGNLDSERPFYYENFAYDASRNSRSWAPYFWRIHKFSFLNVQDVALEVILKSQKRLSALGVNFRYFLKNNKKETQIYFTYLFLQFLKDDYLKDCKTILMEVIHEQQIKGVDCFTLHHVELLITEMELYIGELLKCMRHRGIEEEKLTKMATFLNQLPGLNWEDRKVIAANKRWARIIAVYSLVPSLKAGFEEVYSIFKYSSVNYLPFSLIGLANQVFLNRKEKNEKLVEREKLASYHCIYKALFDLEGDDPIMIEGEPRDKKYISKTIIKLEELIKEIDTNLKNIDELIENALSILHIPRTPVFTRKHIVSFLLHLVGKRVYKLTHKTSFDKLVKVEKKICQLIYFLFRGEKVFNNPLALKHLSIAKIPFKNHYREILQPIFEHFFEDNSEMVFDCKGTLNDEFLESLILTLKKLRASGKVLQVKIGTPLTNEQNEMIKKSN